MTGMGVGYKHLDQLRDLVQNEEDKSSRIRPLFDGMGALDTSIWTGYIIWPKGDTGVHTCRVYDSLDEAVGAAHSKADFHHRPYEVRTAYESPARTIRTINPRRHQ